MPLRTEQHAADALLWIKVVPNASRDQIAGLLGDRLKVRVSAPPEGGKANAAVCKLVALALGVPTKGVSVESGETSAEKVLRIGGMTSEEVGIRLGV